MTQTIDQVVERKEQLKQLLSFNLRGTVVNSFFALFLSYVQLDVLPSRVVFSWLFAIIFVNIMRFAISRYCYNQTAQTSTVVNLRLNIFRAGLILSAVLCGG